MTGSGAGDLHFRFHHVHLNTTDYDSAVDFYVRVLGGKLDHTGEWSGRRTAAIDIGGVRLLVSDRVYPFTGSPGATPAEPHYGLEHFCLTVEDLQGTVDALKSRGARFFTEVHVMRGTLRSAILRAPDNVRIELLGRA